MSKKRHLTIKHCKAADNEIYVVHIACLQTIHLLSKAEIFSNSLLPNENHPWFECDMCDFYVQNFCLGFFCTKICEKSKSTTFSTIKFNTLGYWSMPPQFDVLPAVYSLTFTERHQQNSRHQTFSLLPIDILQLCFFDMFAYCLHQHLVQGRHKCRSEVLDFADCRLQMRI